VSAGGGGGEGDVELNLAPIVDCFTVLIAYLLVSMSFISLGIFDAEVAATGPAPASDAVPAPTPTEIPLVFSVALNDANRIEMKLSGGKENVNQTIAVEAKDNHADLEAMKVKIEEWKVTYPALKEANISADPTIRYKAIVKVIEAVKKTLPKVFLASG